MHLVKAGVRDGSSIRSPGNMPDHRPSAGNRQAAGKGSSTTMIRPTDPRPYRFASLPGGKFNLFIDNEHLDAAAAAIDSFELKAGQTATAPPIRLVHGCLIKGRIIDDATGKAVSLRRGRHLDYSEPRPRDREAGRASRSPGSTRTARSSSGCRRVTRGSACAEATRSRSPVTAGGNRRHWRMGTKSLSNTA